MSHPDCVRKSWGVLHYCQIPSGRECVEIGCDREAGTQWGPLWCPDHDLERLDRVTKSLEGLAERFK